MIEIIGQAPSWLIAAATFSVLFALSLSIYWVIFCLGKNWETELSPGLFTPVSVTFGLIIGFLASQVWSDNNRAISAAMREASALKTIVAVAEVFPDQSKNAVHKLAENYVDYAVNVEWPLMKSNASYHGIIDSGEKVYPQTILLLSSTNDNEASAKQQLLSAFNALYEARSERLLFSGTSVNPLKWSIVSAFSVILLLVTAFVHRSNPKGALLALLIIASAIALSFTLILTHDRPFTGYISISPDLLINAMKKP